MPNVGGGLRKPPEHLSHWTRAELAHEAMRRVSWRRFPGPAWVAFYNQGDLKPHRTRYWLNHEVADEAHFREDVRTVCRLYHQATELHARGVHLISTDEKTGIQALERLHPTRPMAAGKPEAQEFEYVRHGTQALITNFEVATDRIVNPTVGDTRTKDDCVEHIRATVATDP